MKRLLDIAWAFGVFVVSLGLFLGELVFQARVQVPVALLFGFANWWRANWFSMWLGFVAAGIWGFVWWAEVRTGGTEGTERRGR